VERIYQILKDLGAAEGAGAKALFAAVCVLVPAAMGAGVSLLVRAAGTILGKAGAAAPPDKENGCSP